MLLFMNNGQAECVPELFVVFFESFSCNLKIVISGLGWLGSFQPFHMRFIQFFPFLSVLTAHITSSQRPGLPLIRVCVQRSLQPSSVEAFGSCCYAYNNSYRPGLRTANAALAHPRVPADARISAHPRETFGYQGTPSRPWAAGAAAPGEHGPFKFQLCGGGQHRWRRGAGLGPGLLPVRAERERPGEREQPREREQPGERERERAAGGKQPGQSSRRRTARSPAPGEAAAPAPRSLAEAERMRMVPGFFFCLLATISIVT